MIKLNEADISIKTFLNESLIQNMGELFFTEQRIRFIRFEDFQLDKHKNTKRVLNVLNLKKNCQLPSYLDEGKSPVYGNVPVRPGAGSFIPFFNLQFRL